MKPYALSLSVQYPCFNEYLYGVANQQMHTNKCIPVKCVLSYIFIHRHVSVASATIIRVACKKTILR